MPHLPATPLDIAVHKTACNRPPHGHHHCHRCILLRLGNCWPPPPALPPRPEPCTPAPSPPSREPNAPFPHLPRSSEQSTVGATAGKPLLRVAPPPQATSRRAVAIHGCVSASSCFPVSSPLPTWPPPARAASSDELLCCFSRQGPRA
jgi:hypothetical protein